jgi:hypothetical protein
MLTKTLAPVGVIAGFLGFMLPALATDLSGEAQPEGHGIKVWKPYVIEKNCTDKFDRCTVRMDYAPLQRAMVVRPGSYWYQKPEMVYRYNKSWTGSSENRNSGIGSGVCRDTSASIGAGMGRKACDDPFAGN